MIDVKFNEIIYVDMVKTKLHCYVRDHSTPLLSRVVIFDDDQTINNFKYWYSRHLSRNLNPMERVASFEIKGDDGVTNFDKMKLLLKLRGATPEQLKESGLDD